MKQTILIDSATTPDGGEMSLHSHGDDYSIRINGRELMSSRQHNSEQILAEVVCKKYHKQAINVLVGGLGFGYTLKTVMDNIHEKSKVVVVELMECVIKWNTDPELSLGCTEISDARVKTVQADVGKVISDSKNKFDAIILDVDNGPNAITVKSNESLYSRAGLQGIKSALKPGGTVGIWSAEENQQFEKLLKKCGYKVEVIKAYSRPNKGSKHTLFIGSL